MGASISVGKGSIIEGCRIKDNVTIGPYCHLKNCEITEGTTVAPYTYATDQTM